MLTVVLYTVYKAKKFSVDVMIPLTVVCFIVFVVLAVIKSKKVMTKKEYLETLKDIVDFYTNNTLKERKLCLVTGSEGAYVGLGKINQATQIPHQDFYRA
jgi:c-di-AMP phosphodiesterase-like protein